MAEFKEIVDIFGRAHSKYASKDCNCCPMGGTNISQCRKLLLDDPVFFSTNLLKWDKENPKPINWIAWLYQRGIIEDKETCDNKIICSLTEKAYKENVPEELMMIDH